MILHKAKIRVFSNISIAGIIASLFIISCSSTEKHPSVSENIAPPDGLSWEMTRQEVEETLGQPLQNFHLVEEKGNFNASISPAKYGDLDSQIMSFIFLEGDNGVAQLESVAIVLMDTNHYLEMKRIGADIPDASVNDLPGVNQRIAANFNAKWGKTKSVQQDEKTLSQLWEDKSGNTVKLVARSIFSEIRFASSKAKHFFEGTPKR